MSSDGFTVVVGFAEDFALAADLFSLVSGVAAPDDEWEEVELCVDDSGPWATVYEHAADVLVAAGAIQDPGRVALVTHASIFCDLFNVQNVLAETTWADDYVDLDDSVGWLDKQRIFAPSLTANKRVRRHA